MILLFLALPALAFARQTQEATPVDDLKAPTPPALTILGVAPTKVDRPQGVRPLVLSVVSASKDTGFPRNYALEVAPYWMGEPELTFEEYYNRGPKNLFRQLSVSVATTPLGELGTEGTAIGFGLRTLPLPGRAHPQLLALRRQLQAIQRSLSTRVSFFSRRPRLLSLLQSAQTAAGKALVDELDGPAFDAILDAMVDADLAITKLEIQLSDLDAATIEDRSLPEAERQRRDAERRKERDELTANLRVLNASQQALATRMLTAVQQSKAAEYLATATTLQVLGSRVEQAQKTIVDRLQTELRTVALKIQELDRQRVGPVVALAGATGWDVPANDARHVALSRAGVWVTPGYRFVLCPSEAADLPCTASLEILGVVRYLQDRRGGASDSMAELGGRVVWQPFRPLAVSVEWLGRTGAENRPGSRAVGVAEYQFNQSAFLYASFGRDFQEKDVRRTLVSTFGLTLGFGKKPIVDPFAGR